MLVVTLAVAIIFYFHLKLGRNPKFSDVAWGSLDLKNLDEKSQYMLEEVNMILCNLLNRQWADSLQFALANAHINTSN